MKLSDEIILKIVDTFTEEIVKNFDFSYPQNVQKLWQILDSIRYSVDPVKLLEFATLQLQPAWELPVTCI